MEWPDIVDSLSDCAGVMAAALKALDALCAQYDGREALVLAGEVSLLLLQFTRAACLLHAKALFISMIMMHAKVSKCCTLQVPWVSYKRQVMVAGLREMREKT